MSCASVCCMHKKIDPHDHKTILIRFIFVVFFNTGKFSKFSGRLSFCTTAISSISQNTYSVTLDLYILSALFKYCFCELYQLMQ